MINEAKIIFDKIKGLRYLLKEGVGDTDIIDAIQNHEYIYIYYDGDDNVEKGYRTVRPYVLGTTGKGNAVLRAWQDKGRSQSLGPNAKRPKRQNHEYWTDDDGKQKPGWRLFRLDKISKIFPIGKKFEDSDGNVLIPPKYKEGSDMQMKGGITAYVSTKTPKRVVTNVGDIDKPKVIGKAPSAFDKQTGRWKNFFNANKGKRDINATDVQKLYDIARNVYKKSPRDFFIAIDNKNNYTLKPLKIKDRFPQDAIVGDLAQLYDQLVLQNREKTAAEKDFIRRETEKMNKNIQGNNNDTKSFFREI